MQVAKEDQTRISSSEGSRNIKRASAREVVLTRWGPIQPYVLPPGRQVAPLADGPVGLKRTRGSAGAVLAGRLYWVVARGKSRRHGHDLLADGHDRQGSCWLPREVLSATNHHIRNQASREVRRSGGLARLDCAYGEDQAVRVPDLAIGYGFARAFHLATVVPLSCQGSRRAVRVVRYWQNGTAAVV